MLIDFNKAKEVTMPGMNHGTGMMTAKMYMDEKGKSSPQGFMQVVLLECTDRIPGTTLITYFPEKVRPSVTGRKKF